MAFCRISKDSNVYMFPIKNGTILCSLCDLPGSNSEGCILEDGRAAYLHLREHITAGHHVPKTAFTYLNHYISGEEAERTKRNG